MEHFVPKTCQGELCGPCYRQFVRTLATHKVGEEIPPDYPIATHNLTQYVCCQHFSEIMGMAVTQWRGCPDGTEYTRYILGKDEEPDNGGEEIK